METKNKRTDEKSKRRARMKMDRYACNGHLYVTADENDHEMLHVRVTHHRWHQPYTNISISEDVEIIIQEMKGLPAAKVCYDAGFDSILIDADIFHCGTDLGAGPS